jgi:hypothetical protein
MEDIDKEQDIIDLKSQIDKIFEQRNRDIEEIEKRANNAVKLIKDKINARYREYFQLGKFDYKMTKVEDLSGLTLQQLMYLVAELYGVDVKPNTCPNTCPNDWRTRPVLSREYIYGECGVGYHDDESLKWKLTRWLKNNSCIRCESISHNTSKCQKDIN